MAKQIQRFDWALFFLRLGLGLVFTFITGWAKVVGGTAMWEKLGSSMHYIGVTWKPQFWGCMAMLAEFGGGICLLLGILVRPAAVLLLFTMFIATLASVHNGKTFSGLGEIIVIFGGLLCLLLLGSGKLGLRYFIKR
ncbi:MAG: DoxX family protein [Bacteroidetes bacterium]|nr:DoxX family protein [Bacteroidota bacterium]